MKSGAVVILTAIVIPALAWGYNQIMQNKVKLSGHEQLIKSEMRRDDRREKRIDENFNRVLKKLDRIEEKI